MMEITFHGAAEEVGRSCIELKIGKSRFLMDAGLWISEHGPCFPTEIKDLDKIDAVFISHAHLDHTGALPLLEHYGLKCPIFSNIETKLITKILLKDSFKISRIQHDHVAYRRDDIIKVLSLFRDVPYYEDQIFQNIKFKLFEAGHIPGSALILIKTEEQTLLYTGDYNTTATELLKPAKTDYKDVDVLITECTYGNRSHPDRKKEEERFLNKIETTLANNGKVIIPAFAVGRAQEIMLMIAKKEFQVPIYLDGMARQIAQFMSDCPQYLKDGNKFKEVLENVHFIADDRDSILEKPCIIITTSGMVNGGPVMHYLKRLCRDETSSILLTGYQAENTNGRKIVESASAFIDGFLTKIKINIDHFDFSAHSGMDELHQLIQKVNPKQVILQHGDEEAVQKMQEWCNENNYKSTIAKLDEKIIVE